MKWLAQTLLHGLSTRSQLAALRDLAGTCSGRQALVIAGGPSASLLDPVKVAQQQERDLDVLAMNMYADSEMARIVVPDLYVLADPDFFARSGNPPSAEWMSPWEYIRENDVQVVVPASAECPSAYGRSPIRFNNVGLQGWSRNIDPTKPRGYSSMTAYNALAIALHLGYSRVYIAGLDNDMFRHLHRDSARVLRYRSGTHHHPTNNADYVVGEVVGGNLYRGGIAAYFENVARVFGELSLFKDARCVHIDRTTLVDAFAVINDEDAARLLRPPDTL